MYQLHSANSLIYYLVFFLLRTEAPHRGVLIFMNMVQLHSFSFNCLFALGRRWSAEYQAECFSTSLKTHEKIKWDKQKGQRSFTSLHDQHVFSSKPQLRKHEKCTTEMESKQTNKLKRHHLGINLKSEWINGVSFQSFLLFFRLPAVSGHFCG